MPIRFRCTNCDQLMGIARRKAGSLVRCPACRHEIAVPTDATEDPPTPDPMPPPPMPPMPPPPRAGLFDRDDFDALLAGGTSMGGHSVPLPKTVPRPVAERPEPRGKEVAPAPLAVDLVPLRRGIALSAGWVTTLTVVYLLSLAVAFASGLLVGRHVLSP